MRSRSQGGQRYFVLLGDLPENRQVGYLAVGDSRGRGTYIGHFCTSVFNYRANAAALMTRADGERSKRKPASATSPSVEPRRRRGPLL